MNFSMKAFHRLALCSAFFSCLAFASPETAIDWANPPVACIEDLVPKFYPCLDLANVTSPFGDLPVGMSEAETKFWTVDHRADLSLCRAEEVQRREAATPGSQTASAKETAWMWVKQAEDLPTKITAIYDAAETADMPPQILFGALKQESLLSNLGITVDGANFSCGIGQVNLLEWCAYLNSLPPGEQIAMGWPVGISCGVETLSTELVRPFYEIALKKLSGRPDYELTPAEFADIHANKVVGRFPPGRPELQIDRFLAVTNFVKYCSDVHYGIAAKGHELRRLFDTSVPAALKTIQVYAPSETFPVRCQRPYASEYYPLNTGWLLADAIYNAGDREVSVLEYYFRMTKPTYETGAAWKTFTPTKLIEGLHWGGTWNKRTRKIEYANVYGIPNSQTWFKTCVVQRHIASVIQYAALPGAKIAQSLEQGGNCSQTTVPPYRKKSSGRIPVNNPPNP